MDDVSMLKTVFLGTWMFQCYRVIDTVELFVSGEKQTNETEAKWCNKKKSLKLTLHKELNN